MDISNYDFLAEVFRDITEDEVIGVYATQKKPDEIDGWPIVRPDSPEVTKLLDPGPPYANPYFCVSTVTPAPYLKRSFAALQRTYVVVLDDIGTGEGAKMHPDDVPLPPSYSVETSPGNYQYGYLLAEPIADLRVARALIRVMTQDTGDGAAPIPNKMVRLPFGYNNKEKYGLPAPLTRLNIWEPSLRYSVPTLLLMWDIEPSDFDDMVEGMPDPEVAPGTVDSDDDVFNFLQQQGLVRSDQPNHGGFYDIECPWSDEHSEGGNDTAGYSPIGCGGDLSYARQFNCYHDCHKSLGMSDLLNWMFDHRFSYNTSDNTVHDLLKPDVVYKNWAHFDLAMATYYYMVDGKKRYCSRIWRDKVGRVEVKRVTFDPRLGVLGPTRDILTGEPMFNSFTPYTHEPTVKEDKLEPILNQFKQLFGSEYDNWLGFLGYTIHKPDVRIPFALLHIGQHHGTGRGWLKQLIDRMFKYRYHKPSNFKNFMEGQFNEFLYRSLLISFDEVHDRKGKWTIAERLRELITETTQEVNIKNGYKGPINVHANFIFFSNHMDALSFTDEDRRMWCVVCDKPPASQETFRELYALLDDKDAIAQLFWYLKRYIDSAECKFDAYGRAPHTEWRDEIIEENQDDDFDMPVREAIARLAELGCVAVWKSQITRDARSLGADIVHGGSGYNRRLAAVLREMRMSRVRANHYGQRESVYLMPGVNKNKVILEYGSLTAAAAEAEKHALSANPHGNNVSVFPPKPHGDSSDELE